MTVVGQRESRTQKRVIVHLQQLGYDYLGHWRSREGNANVEEDRLRAWLANRDLAHGLAGKALEKLRGAACVGGAQTLYEANREVYGLLRYGVKVKPGVGENHETVWLIDWRNPDRNDFAVAEEVAIAGKRSKRPDLVLYVNGIALAVLELKRSTISVTHGIRQNLDSQKKDFIGHFFTTVQLVLAGNETEGLRYGAIETPEKHWLRWKEAAGNTVDGTNPLLLELGRLDAPSATYLYIDKKMRDHGLFQAICRVNRLDGADKEYGYVVDYKDLFRSLERAVDDYTGAAFASFETGDVAGLLKNRLKLAREHLEEARETVKALCEPVDPPRDTASYIRWFCAAADQGGGDEGHAKRRVTFYRAVARCVRAWANLANETAAAGYSEADSGQIREEIDHYEKVRQEVKLASGDYLDMKVFEPAMRHLLDTYLRAEGSVKVSAFDEMGVVEMLVEHGAGTLVTALPKDVGNSEEAVAETIENNVRRLIVDETAVNPKYYAKMSTLLNDLVEQRRKEALDYREYLQRIEELAKQVARPRDEAYPDGIDTAALRALYDNLGGDNDELRQRLANADRPVRPERRHGGLARQRDEGAQDQAGDPGGDRRSDRRPRRRSPGTGQGAG